MSGDAAGLTVDLDAILDPTRIDDAGIEAGAELLAFVNAIEGGGDAADARAALRASLGESAFIEAAATIAIFNGLVRVADGTGIALDDGVLGYSADLRERSGLNGFAGAQSSDVSQSEPPASTKTSDLFG